MDDAPTSTPARKFDGERSPTSSASASGSCGSSFTVELSNSATSRSGTDAFVADPARSDFEARFPFALDDFQRRALDAIDGGASVVVAAPTGSGKTVIADYAIDRALRMGRRAFYTAPIKALSNQKFLDFSAQLGADRVGLLTGDHSIHDDAPAVVMTTEVLRNMIYAGSPALEQLKYVVLDEVHFLQDPFRGSVWEEVIVHLPLEIDLVCLSATVSNAHEIAEWVSTIRGRTVAVVHDVRPIELDHCYAVEDRATDEIVLLPTFVGGLPNRNGAKFDVGEHGAQRHRRGGPPNRVDLLEELRDEDMLPAITFIFSRSGCDEAVRSCARSGLRLTAPAERRDITEIIRARTRSLSERDRAALEFDRFLAAAQQGYAAHHAGMVPAFRESVEACFNAGLLKAVFATDTLAVGVNMPARTVVLEKLTKFTGERHALLTAGEFTQLTGRAGRRGLDEAGTAVVLWNPYLSFDEVAALARHQSYELRSSFRPSNNMALNLVRRYGATQARHLLGLSLAQFQIDRASVDLRRRLDRLDTERDKCVEAARCDAGDIAEYLARTQRRSVRPNAEPDDVRDALGKLRPGDVLAPVRRDGSILDDVDVKSGADGWLLVIGVSQRRGRGPLIRAIGPNSKLAAFTPTDFRALPYVLDRVRLPEPFNPQSRSFVSSAGGALRNVMSRHGAGRASRTAARRRSPELGEQAVADPVSACPQLKAHLRAHRRRHELDVEIARLQRQLSARNRSIGDHFDRVLDLLEARSFIDGWTITPDGERLAGIFHESDLLIAEALRAGVLDGLNAAQLAGLVSVFVYEDRTPGARGGRRSDNDGGRRTNDLPNGFPKLLIPRWWALQRLAEAVHADEDRRQLPSTRPISAGFVALAQRWASGATLTDVLADGEGLTGGDFVRTVKSLIDLLRQIGDVATDPATALAARSAAESLHRGVVAASSVRGPADGTPASSTAP